MDWGALNVIQARAWASFLCISIRTCPSSELNPRPGPHSQAHQPQDTLTATPEQPEVTMVNALPLLAALTACFATAQAQKCLTTCSTSRDTSTSCTYSCTQMCASLTAGDARNHFLSALNSGGYSCSPSGVTGVVCQKGGSFGTNCYDHYWTCGKNC